MREIRIFSLATHTTKDHVSGVDFLRIIQPSKHLNGYKNKDIKFVVDQFCLSDVDATNVEYWVDVANNYDIFYFNYHTVAEGFAMMGSMARKFDKKLVIDLDDALWLILHDNPAYETYKKGTEAIRVMTDIVNECDYVTCTNSYLRNVIVDHTYKRHEQIKVFPNYIDLDTYSYKPAFKDTYDITLTHFGSTTHFTSLQNQEFVAGLEKIMSEYPNVSFMSVGCFISQFKEKWGLRYDNVWGDSDVLKWVNGRFKEYMDKTDIIIVPLSDNTYNRCKSNCKYLEASSAGKPGCYQNIRQYAETIKNGFNGFLCSTREEWYESIKCLIDDKKLRIDMGDNAYNTLQTHTIQSHIKDYADFFTNILTEK